MAMRAKKKAARKKAVSKKKKSKASKSKASKSKASKKKKPKKANPKHGCGSPCSNPRKPNCYGTCGQNPGHSGDHQCWICGYQWY